MRGSLKAYVGETRLWPVGLWTRFTGRSCLASFRRPGQTGTNLTSATRTLFSAMGGLRGLRRSRLASLPHASPLTTRVSSRLSCTPTMSAAHARYSTGSSDAGSTLLLPEASSPYRRLPRTPGTVTCSHIPRRSPKRWVWSSASCDDGDALLPPLKARRRRIHVPTQHPTRACARERHRDPIDSQDCTVACIWGDSTHDHYGRAAFGDPALTQAGEDDSEAGKDPVHPRDAWATRAAPRCLARR